MASNTSELLPILKALREYIVKEYGVNYPPHVRGEDASGKDLPSNWVDKLAPLSGGDTVGRDAHGSQGTKSTRSGAQGTDPYIHKSELEAMLKDFAKHFVDGRPVQAGSERADGMHGAGGFSYPGDGQRIPEGRGLGKEGHEEMEEEEDMMDDMVEDVEDDEMVEDEAEDVGDEEWMNGDEEGVEKNYMSRSADGISELLKDIKGLLSSRHQEKQEYAAISSEINDLKKSVNGQVRDGIKKGLKQFNLNPSRGDTMTRLGDGEESSNFGVPQPVEMPDQRIGVEGESFQKSSEEEGQEQFVNGIEEVTSRTDVNDLRGHFKLVNGMRNQTGELTPHTLYYYPTQRNGNRGGK